MIPVRDLSKAMAKTNRKAEYSIATGLVAGATLGAVTGGLAFAEAGAGLIIGAGIGLVLSAAYCGLAGTAASIALLVFAVTFDRGGPVSGPILTSIGLSAGIFAASSDHTTLALLKEVMPGADSFSEKEGVVPVYKAYRTDPTTGEKTLIGYAVVTSDVLPEPSGYSGPIDSLIGMNLEGTIVGLRVIYYKESLRYSIGDFFEWPGYEDQFIGKVPSDKFRVHKDGDIDGIARATISVKAMTAGVRQTVRAVYAAYIE
ncbi:MAG: FMN-binding protein [Gammaproteobacteria bacterium]|nr:FMN-binding protein [Gammaproteobacteria bacterium]